MSQAVVTRVDPDGTVWLDRDPPFTLLEQVWAAPYEGAKRRDATGFVVARHWGKNWIRLAPEPYGVVHVPMAWATGDILWGDRS